MAEIWYIQYEQKIGVPTEHEDKNQSKSEQTKEPKDINPRDEARVT